MSEVVESIVQGGERGFISGSASIDFHGEILYPGDVSHQLERTFININTLLDEADATMTDMQVLLVCLRGSVLEELEKLVPNIPSK